jgi:hypothetical protein
MSTTTYGTALQGAAPDSTDRDGGAPQEAHTGEALPAAPRPASAASGDNATRVYRGRSVDALIAKIQSELGPDAIVVRHHKGLTGGIAGFFQRPFVEIEARSGTPRVDRYDDAEPALPAALAQSDLGQSDLGQSELRQSDLRQSELGPNNLGQNNLGPSELGQDNLGQNNLGPNNLRQNNLGPSELGQADLGQLAPGRTSAAQANGRLAALAAGGSRGAAPHDALARFAGGLDAQAIAEEFRELTPASLLERVPVHNGSEETVPVQASDPFAAALAEAEAAVLPLEVPQHAFDPEEPAIGADPPVVDTPAGASSRARAAGAAATPAATSTATPTPRGRARGRIEDSLQGFGVGEAFVRELIETASAHVLPLMPARASLASAVHRTISQRIPSAPPLPVGGATIALVGPGGSGKTACCAALLEAYRERSTLPAACATIVPGAAHGELAALLSPDILEPTPIAAPELAQALRDAREEGLLLLDLPALSPNDRAGIRACADLLETLAPDRVILALPATLGRKPAAQLLEALRPLAASALAITHADETDQLGVAVETACAFELAPTYLLDLGHGRGGLIQIDPAYLADRLLS